MPRPAQPSVPPGPPEPSEGLAPAASFSSPRATNRRTPRKKVAAAVLAAFGGIVLLTIGIAQTAGGLAGPSVTANAASPSLAPAVSPSTGPAAGASGSASVGPASPTPTTAATPAPSGPPLVPSGGPPGGLSDTALRDARLQATLDLARTRLAIPGVSVTILFPDGTTWTGGSGLANIASRTPVGPDTAFAFASMSKTFTSALVVQLISEGRLRLTDSASRLLPKLAKPIDPRITIAMLLDHTSGLQDYFLNPRIDKPLQAQPARAWTTAQALAYTLKPYFPPGRGWHYSNTNYLLLGLIAERVTGQPLDIAIRTRLLDPSGLKAIWYQAKEQPREPLAHGYRLPGTKLTVKPIDLDDGTGVAPFRSVVTAAAGAGSMAGTSADLARWARLLYSGEVLGPEGTAVLLGGFSATAAYKPRVAYGYGVQAITIDGHASFGHSGRLLGFRGVLRHFPIEGVTIAVLTNQSRADPAEIARSLLAVALPPPPPCPICSIAR